MARRTRADIAAGHPVMAPERQAPRNRRRPAVISPLPPPPQGISVVSRAILDALQGGADPIVFDLAPASITRSAWVRFRRLPRVLRMLVRFGVLSARGKIGTAYIPVSGGWGQIYDALYVLIARSFGIRVVLHHHCYSYLLERRRRTAVLLRIAGARTLHVLLCEPMRRRLDDLYGTRQRALILSNAAVLARDARRARARPRVALRTIGFLGNISAAKGIFEFLALVETLREDGIPIRARVAGPIAEPRIARRVKLMIERLDVEYLGLTTGDAKWRFLDSIDALVLPSRLIHEAEPLVVYEAMASGATVIATGRGCLPSRMESALGAIVLQESDPFARRAADAVRTWVAEPRRFEEASRHALKHYGETAAASADRLDELLAFINHLPLRSEGS